jgi:hypothetical protein
MAGLEFGDTKSMVRLIEIMFLAAFVLAIATAWYRTQKKMGGGDGGGEPPRTQPATVIVRADEE